MASPVFIIYGTGKEDDWGGIVGRNYRVSVYHYSFLVFCDDDEDFEIQNWFVSSTLFSLFLQASGKDESDNPDTNGGHLTCFVLQASNHAVPLCWLVSYSYFSAPISRASKILAQGRLPHSLSECVAITTCTPNILPVALFEDTSLHWASINLHKR